MIPEQAQTISVFRNILRKKLGNEILPMVDSIKSKRGIRINKRVFPEYQQIARKYAWDAELSMLESIGNEFTLAQIGVERQKEQEEIERKQEEEKLKRYLMTACHLQKIQPGLIIRGKEKQIKSGRLDLIASDIEGKNKTLIECKAPDADYDVEHVYFQLSKYLGECQDHNAIFIASKIKPALYFALKKDGLIDSGRLKLFNVEKDEDIFDYEFFPVVSEDDLDEGRIELRFDKFTKRKRNSDFITIRNYGRAPVSTRVAKKPDEVMDLEKRVDGDEAQEEIDWGIHWDDAPLYQKAVWLTFRPLNYLEYQGPVFTIRKKVNELEDLVSPSDFTSALEDVEEYGRILDTVHQASSPSVGAKSKKQERIVNSGFDEVRKRYDSFRKMRAVFDKNIVQFPLGNTFDVSKLEELSLDFNKLLTISKYSDESFNRYKKVLNELINDTKTGRVRGYLGVLLQTTGFTDQVLFNEFLKLKIKRAKKLAEVDLPLAQTYLKFSIVTDNLLNIVSQARTSERKGVVKSKDPMTINASDKHYMDYMNNDTLLYKSILSIIKPAEEPHSFQGGEEIPSGTFHPQEQVVPAPKPVIREPTPYETLEHAVYSNGHKDHLSKDSKLRIKYFIQDIEAQGASEDYVKAIQESFAHFNLAKKLRKREEMPSETQLRSFFDDVTLGYVTQGKVPSIHELENIYKEVKEGN